MMITTIQKQKIAHLFDVLDSSKNQILQPDDFTLVADRISNILKYSKNSTKRLELHSRSFRLFIQLLTDLEKEEASISKDEWNYLFENVLLQDERIIKSYIQRTAAYIFMLFDQNNDRMVSEEEYLDMFMAYEIPEEYVKTAFNKLDENEDGVLSRSEIINGLHAFFLSSDPQAKGNWIFGNWKVEPVFEK